MARLIDAHMLLEELQKATALSTRGQEYNRGLLEAQRLTINAPTEEERPRGEWHTAHNPNYSPFDSTSTVIYMCSQCAYSSGDRITETRNRRRKAVARSDERRSREAMERSGR